MINTWRNWFIDPETGLPWATVMMFPWLKYGINPTQPPKRSLKVPVQNTEKVVQTVVQKEKSSKPKTAAIKKDSSDKKLPIKAPKHALIKVEKTPSQTTVAQPKITAKTVEKVSNKTVKQAPKKVKVAEKTKSVAVKKTKKAPENKTPTKEKQQPTINQDAAITATQISLLDVASSNTQSTDKTSTKKVEFVADEVIVAPVVKKVTPINIDKMPIKVQNLITQINPSSPKAQIREAVVLLCTDQWAEKEALAEKLKFKTSQLETLHLTPMVNSGQLLLRYPQQLDHPEQAYRVVSKKNSK